MRDREIKLASFIQTAQDLHEEGREWLALSEIARQMHTSDTWYTRRRLIANRLFGLVGMKMSPEPSDTRPIDLVAMKLEREGKLEYLYDESRPIALSAQDKLWRLTEEFEAQVA